MPEPNAQTFKNHTRMDPPFHFFIMPVLLLTFIAIVVILVRMPHPLHVWFAILGFTLLLLAFKTRMYALKVQDRVIRLEERLRLMALLSEPTRSRIHELTESQLVALRFASDDEIPALVERSLNEHLTLKQIKESIQNWRPDHFRI